MVVVVRVPASRVRVGEGIDRRTVVRHPAVPHHHHPDLDLDLPGSDHSPSVLSPLDRARQEERS
jgi:hypothetical protein